MIERELSQKVSAMCSGCAHLNVKDGGCLLVPPFLSKLAQETKAAEGICAEAAVFDVNGGLHRAISNFSQNVWLLTIQE